MTATSPTTTLAPAAVPARWMDGRHVVARVAPTVGFVSVLVLAAAARWWHLWDIPSSTDELLGVGRGLQVARGQILPLTDFEPYIGSFWNYVLALGFLLAGPSEYVGRGIPFLVGILTVGATFLLATSSAHILATSHPAWSHCFSPLFAALGLWQLQRCVRQDNARGLLASAFWLGLAVQTHPTMAALLPGVGGYLLLKRRAWMLSRWPYLGAGVGVLLLGNIIAFNLITDFGSVRRAAAVGTAYARGRGAGIDLYAGNIQRMGLLSLQVVSGVIDIRDRPRDYLQDPRVIGPGVLALAGALLLSRRGNPIVFLAALPFAAMLAILNAKYEVIPNARFLTPLLPLAFAGTGALLGSAWQSLAARPTVGPLLASGGLGVVVCTLAAISLLGLAGRYDQMESSARTTAMLRSAVDSLEQARTANEPILLDRNLDRLWLDGGGDVWMALNFELTRRNAPVSDLPRRVTPPFGETDPCVAQRVIVARIDRSRGVPRWLGPGFRADPDDLPRQFWTFRIVPAAVQIGPLAPNEWVVLEYEPPISGSARTVDHCAPGRLI